MSHHTGHGHSKYELGHIVPTRTFTIVFVALLVLTAITVGISYIDFGMMNIVVAMFVASIKAMLVALFFMHLKYEKPETWLYAAFPIILLACLIGGVYIDNPFRSDNKIYLPEVTTTPSSTPAKH